MSKLIPVVMAGGTGSRLWPLSRESFPKQFLSIDKSGFSLLQQTLQRLDGLEGIEIAAPLVICNEEHRFLVAEQLREIDQLATNIILEPVGRNTAPAVALAAHLAAEENSDSILLVLAADHLIKKVNDFHTAIRNALEFASQNYLVTFGIIPESPETGYGYIKRGVRLSDDCFRVDAFVEKPCLDKAIEYLACGEYSWNSGMFMFKTEKLLAELEALSPEIYSVTRQCVTDSQRDMNFIRVDTSKFRVCPSDSIDYALMEKTQSAVVVPINVGWSDVGSWSSLWDVSDKDVKGNVTIGDVISINSENNYISSDTSLVTTIGLDNIVIINTSDALLVAAKDQVQDVKKIVDELKKRNLHHYRHHSTCYRPWGSMSDIDNGEHYQVKNITVHPGEGLSVQRHLHRAEYWVVVSGTAKVKIEDTEFFLSENQSAFIPAGSVHTLENPGKIDLKMIEVRSGNYLGEDDIERIHDRYGRA
ncbi:Mannose-1-phosphate guanylyltransferase rfbM [Serratia fonticola]|uniref:mannose-1-phosphate guanylyltransferase/mannose-6-phosphate isomerase n=1 Tax=Serratia fonticola TaxID=47917 RepID=UPI0021781F9D|nr:mannose-1-phosphate guanylyltransferase/mannose-6-phosphate isomerase [Serratia fonticola]CAI1854433.1 Mannose-1-phosphate guanylyltransferase rfbM [Serratia fonticola]